eukprot:scaffold83_cov286-Prasinococcus_capsulatus_cf.AAC.8
MAPLVRLLRAAAGARRGGASAERERAREWVAVGRGGGTRRAARRRSRGGAPRYKRPCAAAQRRGEAACHQQRRRPPVAFLGASLRPAAKPNLPTPLPRPTALWWPAALLLVRVLNRGVRSGRGEAGERGRDVAGGGEPRAAGAAARGALQGAPSSWPRGDEPRWRTDARTRTTRADGPAALRARAQPGDLVWAKMASFPWWPAIIMSPEHAHVDARECVPPSSTRRPRSQRRAVDGTVRVVNRVAGAAADAPPSPHGDGRVVVATAGGLVDSPTACLLDGWCCCRPPRTITRVRVQVGETGDAARELLRRQHLAVAAAGGAAALRLQAAGRAPRPVQAARRRRGPAVRPRASLAVVAAALLRRRRLFVAPFVWMALVVGAAAAAPRALAAALPRRGPPCVCCCGREAARG